MADRRLSLVQSCRRLARLMLLSVALGCGTAAASDQATPVAEDPVLEEKVQELAYQLRCLVCQNETIAESRAPLAHDLRQQVREQFAAGKSRDEVIDFLVSRYGDFILYKPPFKGTTLLLWLGPAVLLVAGLGWLGVRLRRRTNVTGPSLSEAERQRARALLEGSATVSESEEPRS